jgi:hypothetical protein
LYGEVNLNTQKIIPLGNNDPVGINSDAMIYKNFYVGSTATKETISEFVLNFLGKMLKWAGDLISSNHI